MKTEFLLLAQYDGKVVLPVDVVCRDFFSHLSPEKFVRNVSDGKIAIPMMRMDGSAKAARGVHVADLAAYLDERRSVAQKECKLLSGRG